MRRALQALALIVGNMALAVGGTAEIGEGGDTSITIVLVGDTGLNTNG